MFAPYCLVDARLIEFRRYKFPSRERFRASARNDAPIIGDIGRQHMLSVDCCISIAKTDFQRDFTCARSFRSGILFRMETNFNSKPRRAATVIVAVPARARPPG
jgi:hypothetical protein